MMPMTDPWCWYINANMTGDILMGSMAHHIYTIHESYGMKKDHECTSAKSQSLHLGRKQEGFNAVFGNGSLNPIEFNRNSPSTDRQPARLDYQLMLDGQ